METKTIRPSKTIYQSNSLIESRHRLNTNEMRLVMFLLSTINEKDTDFWTYKVQTTELGISPKRLKESCRSVMSKVIEIDEEDGWLMTHWFSSLKYIKNTSYVEFSFDPKLRPYLLSLKRRFTVIDLKNVLEMKSSYSIRIYQLLKQYQKIGHRTFTIQELQDTLKIPKSYLWNDIKKNIIEVSQKEVQDTDLQFNYDIKKEGKKVTEIKFWINKVDCSLYEFIKEKRKSHGGNGKVLVETTDKDTKERIHLAVSRDGMLYNKLDIDWKITKERAMEIWKTLYELRGKGI